MKNIMTFDGGYKAVIAYDPDIEMFRGEFVGLSGGADFYAADLSSLRHEGSVSLNTFLDVCREQGISPRKKAGKFALRLEPELYTQLSLAASASGQSMNQFIVESLQGSLRLQA